jgi:hypothetical protein
MLPVAPRRQRMRQTPTLDIQPQRDPLATIAVSAAPVVLEGRYRLLMRSLWQLRHSRRTRWGVGLGSAAFMLVLAGLAVRHSRLLRGRSRAGGQACWSARGRVLERALASTRHDQSLRRQTRRDAARHQARSRTPLDVNNARRALRSPEANHARAGVRSNFGLALSPHADGVTRSPSARRSSRPATRSRVRRPVTRRRCTGP